MASGVRMLLSPISIYASVSVCVHTFLSCILFFSFTSFSLCVIFICISFVRQECLAAACHIFSILCMCAASTEHLWSNSRKVCLFFVSISFSSSWERALLTSRSVKNVPSIGVKRDFNWVLFVCCLFCMSMLCFWRKCICVQWTLPVCYFLWENWTIQQCNYQTSGTMVLASQQFCRSCNNVCCCWRSSNMANAKWKQRIECAMSYVSI